MIVPSMTHDEMRNELMHDYQVADARAQHFYKQLLFEMRKRHQKHAIETVTWKSPLHNTWMSFYDLNDKQVNYFHVCITMDHHNLLKTLCSTGIDSETIPFISEFNIHFFKRYNERMKLNLPKPLLIVKHYFKNNLYPSGATELFDTEDPLAFKIFVPVNGGVLLGYQHNDKKWLDIKTFVSNEMLRENQKEDIEFLRQYLLHETKG